MAPNEPAMDKAIMEYVKMYQQPLPPKAIEALRKATKLGSKPVDKALQALAEEQEDMAATA